MTDKTIKIERIQVWDDGHVHFPSLHSIRVVLTNGKKSPLFGSRYQKKNTKNVVLDERAHTLAVNLEKADGNTIFGLKFSNQNKKEISCWELNKAWNT